MLIQLGAAAAGEDGYDGAGGIEFCSRRNVARSTVGLPRLPAGGR